MSAMNTLLAKRQRRRERAERKARLAETRPDLKARYVRIDAVTVRQHRYLAMHGLPFSEQVAMVVTPRDLRGAA